MSRGLNQKLALSIPLLTILSIVGTITIQQGRCKGEIRATQATNSSSVEIVIPQNCVILEASMNQANTDARKRTTEADNIKLRLSDGARIVANHMHVIISY